MESLKKDDVKGRATATKGRDAGGEGGEVAISFIRDEIEETGHDEETLNCTKFILLTLVIKYIDYDDCHGVYNCDDDYDALYDDYDDYDVWCEDYDDYDDEYDVWYDDYDDDYGVWYVDYDNYDDCVDYDNDYDGYDNDYDDYDNYDVWYDDYDDYDHEYDVWYDDYDDDYGDNAYDVWQDDYDNDYDVWYGDYDNAYDVWTIIIMITMVMMIGIMNMIMFLYDDYHNCDDD
nr:PREDICTED: MATH and LRR domain-containing protein PFE0570w-like [Megachile rotundata]